VGEESPKPSDDAGKTPKDDGVAEPSPSQDLTPSSTPAPAGEPTGGGSMFPAIVLLAACGAAIVAILSLGNGKPQDAANPDQIQQHLDEAQRLLQSERNPVEALVYLEKALTADADNVHANVLTGAALISLGKSEEAMTYLDHAYELAPEDLSVLRHRALALQDLQRWDEARPMWQKVLEGTKREGGDPSTALFQLATNYMFKGELNKAIEHLRAHLELQPTNALAHQMHSDALGGLGRNAESVAAMESVIKLVPEHVPTRHGLQSKRIGYQGFAGALEHYAERAAAAQASDLDHYLYGRMLARQPGKGEAARKEFEAALDANPQLYWAMERLAYLDLRAGDAEQARERAALAIELAGKRERPDPFFSGHMRLAAAERARGDYAAALEELQPLLNKSGYAFTAAREYLGCLLDSGDTEQALEFAKTQTAGKPPSAQQALLLAVTYRALGKPDLQRGVLEAALKHQPEGSGWKLELALHELEQGRPEAAAAQFEAILEAYPEDKPLLPYLAFWSGYAVAGAQPETARARWKRGRERPRAWPDAFWGDACGRALGEVDAEALAESALLEGVGQRNCGPFVEGFACEQAGDTAGARAHYEEVLANARLGGHEFPAGVARARLDALGD